MSKNIIYSLLFAVFVIFHVTYLSKLDFIGFRDFLRDAEPFYEMVPFISAIIGGFFGYKISVERTNYSPKFYLIFGAIIGVLVGFGALFWIFKYFHFQL